MIVQWVPSTQLVVSVKDFGFMQLMSWLRTSLGVCLAHLSESAMDEVVGKTYRLEERIQTIWSPEARQGPSPDRGVG